MKKLIKLTLVVALVLGSSSLFAQKLGRINLEEIITLMPEYKEMMTNMEAYSKDLRDNLETIQVELNTKYNDFQKNKATYSEVNIFWLEPPCVVVKHMHCLRIFSGHL